MTESTTSSVDADIRAGLSASEGPYLLSARGLHKTLGRGPSAVHVLRGIDLELKKGAFLAVMGPSGCGKSTLLHVLGLITPPDAGTLLIDGVPAPSDELARAHLRRRAIGIVFQRFNLLGVLSAADNVEISLRVRGIAQDGQVRELFEKLDISHVARRKPSQMSIGQQQRVAVARAIAHRPRMLLADEPTGNLDSANAKKLLEEFRRINRDLGQTIVMITHSPQAASYADRILRMTDGRIE